MDIRRLVRKDVQRLRAYNATEVPCRIKLDANESPYGFSAALRSAAGISTNRYPDPEATLLRGILARDLAARPENILQGNGSDELIYYLIATFGGPVLFPTPTFSMYGIISRALGEKPVGIPLDAKFDLDLKKILSAVRKERPKLIFLSSPNNPTGNCFSAEKMLKIIGSSTGIVVVDEAYQPFSSRKGFLPMLKDYRNLVIMRTLSKIGLAALRIGYLIADTEIIEEVNKVRLPFNVNALSQAVAVAALQKRGTLERSVRSVKTERSRMFSAMGKIKGVRPYPSEANFILFQVEDPVAVHASLLKKGILVRNIADVVPGCLRVTVGTRRENSSFIRALVTILSAKV